MRHIALALGLTLVVASPVVAQTSGVAIGSCVAMSGSGSPEGSVTGKVCDTYWRTDNGSIYTKTSGTNTTTGWTVLSSASSGGTVTSVAFTAPGIFSVAGTPVTTSGTIALSLATQSAKTFFAGPTSGSAATPTFRTIGTDDLPVCASTKIYKSDGTSMVCDDDAGASSGAPTASQYVTLATDATLTNERVLTAGTGVTLTDAGAGSTLTVDLDTPVAFANGGTGLSSASDDTVMVSNGSAWQAKALGDCDDAGGNHLNYDTTTNAFSCGTSGGASGYATVQDEGSGLTQRQTINFTGTGVSCADNSGSSRTDCTINSGTSEADGVVAKTGDTSRNSTTSPTSDPDLQFSVDASSHYFFEVFLLMNDQSSGTADFKFQWSLPASATMQWGGLSTTATNSWMIVGTGSVPSALNSESTVLAQGGGAAASITGIVYYGVLHTAGTSGTAAFQWAQNTNNGSDITLKAGSFIRYRKLN